ncbi:hypothetical protein GCM10009094_02450 [Massilia aurea]
MDALFDGTGWAGWSTTTGAGLAGGLGMYSGPVWPQPARAEASSAAPKGSAREDFTIRIKV